MIITGRTRMRAYEKLQHVLKVSNVDFQAEVKRFDVPKKLKLIPVTDISDIPIKYIFAIWDCKDNNELLKNTIDIFLTNKWWKKVLYRILFISEKSLPLVDFTRLVIYTNELAILTADYFKSCKTIQTDSRIDDILKKYNGSHQDIIAQFCESFPAYTLKTALEVSWHDIYLCIQSRTTKANIQIEVSQLEPKK